MKTLYLKVLRFFILCFVLAGFSQLKAQYVYIEDSLFSVWLQQKGYCVTNRQMDTTCLAVLNATRLSLEGFGNSPSIRDVTPVHYFKNLRYLGIQHAFFDTLPDVLPVTLDSLKLVGDSWDTMTIMGFPPNLTYIGITSSQIFSLPQLPSGLKTLDVNNDDYISTLPALPSTLEYLNCNGNMITSLPALPSSLKTFHCAGNRSLTGLPALPAGLELLQINDDSLLSLPPLPTSLKYLWGAHNFISSLPSPLPSSLISLDCNDNLISTMPSLPAGLQGLDCGYNFLSGLPPLPTGLGGLNIDHNNFTVMPPLPAGLGFLNCGNNPLGSLPTLPANLQELRCRGNQLTALPSLPASLWYLYCDSNSLTVLPALPQYMNRMECSHNLLTTLPAIPASLERIFADHNKFTSLPDFGTNTIDELWLNDNPTLKCLPRLPLIHNFYFYNTGVKCLPYYLDVTNSNPLIDTFPICDIFNADGCKVYYNIGGRAYIDKNENCVYDQNDAPIKGVTYVLRENGVYKQQAISSSNGNYAFRSGGWGSFFVASEIGRYDLLCPPSGTIGPLNISAVDSTRFYNDFAYSCDNTGIDMGILDISYGWMMRPGDTIKVRLTAGDMVPPCAAGTSGEISLFIDGEVTYLGVDGGTPAPTSVANNTITWNISDLATVNIYKPFVLIMKVNNFATVNDMVCFYANVNTTLNDLNIFNDTMRVCHPVVTSCDPNQKEVMPDGDIEPSQTSLIYTIRFQNTGNAPARNIYILDTLDSDLDPTTFQLLNSSHENVTQVFDNVIRFNFPNIELADSIHNEPESHGYIRFKIKLRNGRPIGTQITNTVDIYFDYNAPVRTNTTLNTIVSPSGISAVSSSPNVRVYPNPFSGYTTFEILPDVSQFDFALYDMLGQNLVTQKNLSGHFFMLQRSDLPKGCYLYRIVMSDKRELHGKLLAE